MSFAVPLQKLHEAFRQHLAEPRNQRVIFSGAFGIGKTYFLKEYFAAQPDNYIAVKLSPVNYSVSSNDDIFQLIKYDILFELIATYQLQLTATPISRKVAYGVLLQDKLPAVLEGMVNIVPLLNKDLEPISTVWAALTSIIPFIKQVEEQRKDPELNSRLLDFVKATGKLPALESDYITSFIEESLQMLAAGHKQRVLIIDDLDRIDPEHIFRLFNIFSAHLDYDKGTNNKFGFDKVIFVCDITNIRNIFHSRYGATTDFNGYIDKFYSTEIFIFDNREQLLGIIEEVITSIQPPANLRAYFEENIFHNTSNGLLAVLLTELIYAGKLSIRRLVTIYGANYPYTSRELDAPNNSTRINSWQLTGIVVMQLLSYIIGGANALDKALQRLKEYETRSKHYRTTFSEAENYLVGELLPIIDYKQHNFKYSGNHEMYALNSGKQSIGYQLVRVGARHQIYFAQVSVVDGQPYRNQDLHLFDKVYDAFLIMRKLNLFSE